MNKGYVILEIGWEYNDETYNSGNYGEKYEAPKEIFLDKDRAEKIINKKNIDAFKNRELGVYLGEDIEYYLSKGFSDDDLYKYIKETFDVELNEDWFNFSVPEDATDEQVEGLMKIIKLRFFTLKEVSIG